MKLANITIDCQEPGRLVAFWAGLLGWTAASEDDLVSPPTGSWFPTIWFQEVAEPKQVKNRLHLDINVDDVEAAVGAAVAAGATDLGFHREKFGPFEGSHNLLQDPEGNEFCLQANPTRAIAGPYLCNVTFDCAQPFLVARFWAQAVGYPWVEPSEEFLATLRDNGVTEADLDSRAGLDRPGTRIPRLWFQRVPEPKVGKNRVHLDLSSAQPGDDVEALSAAGARTLQVQEHWIVMADPEGNEFCISEQGA